MRRCSVIVILVGLVGVHSGGQAQQVRRSVENSPDGYIRLSFAARLGVCETGDRRFGRQSDNHWMSFDTCTDGPVLVQIQKEDGSVVRLRTYVGGRWRTVDRNVTDLGVVSAPDAAGYLIGLVRSDPVAHRAIYPATLADSSEVWPQLLVLARDDALDRRTNKEAMRWLGIAAGRVFNDDESQDDRSEVRRGALFSVSQLPADEGIPRLIDVFQTHRYEYMRRLAVFWLGQSGDERALPVIERVLRMRG